VVCAKRNGQLYINLKYYGDKSTDCSSHTVRRLILVSIMILTSSIDPFLQ